MDQATEALIIESFLERSASQLTYHGLVELTAAMNDGEVAVLFRNNHFSTVKPEEYLLNARFVPCYTSLESKRSSAIELGNVVKLQQTQ